MSEQEDIVGQGLGGRLRNMLFPVAALKEKKFISNFTFLFLQKKDTQTCSTIICISSQFFSAVFQAGL